MSPAPDNELMELNHEPVPGYKPVFYGLLAVACVYLGVLLFNYLSHPA